jgi:hypothetical protein
MDARPTDSLSAPPRCGDPCSSPLSDELALKLGDRAHDVKDQPPAGGRGIKPRIVQGDQVDAEGAEIFDHSDQMAEGASQTIELPDHDSVEISTMRSDKHPV